MANYQDIEIGKTALALCFLDENRLAQCLQSHSEAVAGGEQVAFMNWLIRHGHLTADQARQVEQRLNSCDITMCALGLDSQATDKTCLVDAASSAPSSCEQDRVVTAETYVVENVGERTPTPDRSGATQADSDSRIATQRQHKRVQPMRLNRLGRYEIVQELGKGGMGQVYKAHDSELDRPVAIKVLLAGMFATAADTERFLREARAMAKLQHPNIVPVYDIGNIEGHHFFAMDFVDGVSLKSFMQSQAAGWNDTSAMLEKIARAVHYAHTQGIIHRDLKPGNVMIDKAGEPKVMDFGLAKIGHADDAISHSGMIIGTLQYMSPEQAEGRIKEVDARSDIYALGAILYEMLCGRPPIALEESFTLMIQSIVRQPVTPPAKVRPDVPPALAAICMKALHKKKDQRYQSALDMAEDLASFRAGRQVQASAVKMQLPPIRLNKKVAMLLAALVLIPLLWHMATNSRPLAMRIVSPAALQNLSRLEMPATTWELEITGELPDAAPQVKIMVGKHTAERDLKTARFTAEVELAYGKNDVELYVIDGDRVRYRRRWEIVRLPQVEQAMSGINIGRTGVSMKSGVPQMSGVKWKLATNGWIDTTPAMADGTVYVGGRDHNLYAVHAETGRVRWKFTTGDHIFSSPAVADGKVYFGSDDGVLYAVDVNTGKKKWIVPAEKQFRAPPLVLDGVVYVGNGDGVLYALDGESGKIRWRFASEGRFDHGAAAGDGCVFIGSDDGRLYALDQRTGTLRWKIDIGHDMEPVTYCGGKLYFGSFETIYAVNANDGQTLWKFEADSLVCSGVACENGLVLFGIYHRLFADRCGIRAVDAKNGCLVWKFGQGSGISTPVIAAGTVYAGGRDGHLYALDFKTGERRWEYATLDQIMGSPCVGDGVVYIGSWDCHVYALK